MYTVDGIHEAGGLCIHLSQEYLTLLRSSGKELMLFQDMCVQTHVHKTIKCIKLKIYIKVVMTQSKEILRCSYQSCKYYSPIIVYCA